MKKLLAFIALTSMAAMSSIAAQKVTQPNIILILADDLGIGNISCYGADHFKTPNIEALVREADEQTPVLWNTAASMVGSETGKTYKFTAARKDIEVILQRGL